MGIFIHFFGGAFGGVGRFYFYRYCLQFPKSSPQKLCPLIVEAVANADADAEAGAAPIIIL